MRSSSVLFEQAISKDDIRPYHLIYIDFESDPVRVTDYPRNITWDGYLWASAGHLLGFSDIKENKELRVDEVTITLSGVDQTVVSGMLNNNLLDNRVKIYYGVESAANEEEPTATFVDPMLVFEGSIASYSFQETKDTVTCSMRVSNVFADFNRVASRHTTDAEQQHYFPGDRGFEFAPRIKSDLTWGKAS